jgi:hypothetical protein
MFEKKYLKYKLKYLELKLIGGGNTYIWPDDYKKLEKLEQLQSRKFKIKSFDNVKKLEYINTNTNSINNEISTNKLINSICNIFRVDNEILNLINVSVNQSPHSPYNITNIVYKDKLNKIRLEEIDSDINTDNKNEEKNYNVNTNITDRKENLKLKNNLELEINKLKERLEKLENEFENHYHDMPTTGIRQFKNQHPYYKTA